jgi:hypothetical protein
MTIQLENIRDVLKKNKDIEGVKIDIEGAEMDILEKVNNWGKVNQIVLEWDFGRDNRTSRLLKVIQKYKKLGFKVEAQQPLSKFRQIKEWKFWPSGVILYFFK